MKARKARKVIAHRNQLGDLQVHTRLAAPWTSDIYSHVPGPDQSACTLIFWGLSWIHSHPIPPDPQLRQFQADPHRLLLLLLLLPLFFTAAVAATATAAAAGGPQAEARQEGM